MALHRQSFPTPAIRQVFFKLDYASESLGWLVSTQIAGSPSPEFLSSVDLSWAPRNYISNRLPDDVQLRVWDHILSTSVVEVIICIFDLLRSKINYCT